MMRRWIAARWDRDERLRFVVVGGWNTAFGYLAFIALYGLLHRPFHYLAIGALSQAISTVNAFVGYRVVVFRSRKRWLAEFARFTASQLVVLWLGLATLWLLVRFAGFGPLVAQAFVTVLSVAVSYLAHRRFSFADR